MTIRIIDNQKVDLTDEEYNMYLNIAASYDDKQFQGKTLFEGLFQSDENGIIQFIKPPSKKMCSLEIYLFITSIFSHQHMRLMHKQIDDLCAQVKKKFDIT
jgi:hypothetical protein